MEISDQDLRTLVREVIAGQIRSEATSAPPSSLASHGSHTRLTLLTSGDADGFCLIEPAVRCTHCGYCQSFGH